MLKKFLVLSILAVGFLLPLTTAQAASAVNATYSLSEDAVKTVPLRGGCNRNESKTLTVGTASHGTVTLSGTNAIYTPTTNYNGNDSFTFSVSCSSSGSATGSVSLTITSVNDIPTATTTTAYTTPEDTTLTGQVTGSDVDNDPLTFSASSAMGGSIAMDTAGRFTFTPVTNTSGSGSFTYRVWDGRVYSPAVTVAVTITAVNDAPSANDISRSLNEDGGVTVTLTGSDVDSSTLTYSVTTQPMFGSVSLSSNSATYIPNANYNGSDQFSYVVSDGTATSNVATVVLTITAANDTPTAEALNVTTDSRTAVDITLAGADVDGDVLTYSLPIAPLFGSVNSITGNQVRYTPRDGFVGEDTFTYAVSDGMRTMSAVVTVLVQELPHAGEITVAVVQGNTVTISPIGEDPFGDTITYVATSEPRHGTVDTTANPWTYSAPADYVGIDTFMYTANTATTSSDPMTIRLNITAPTGIPGTDIVQIGVNFLNLMDANTLVMMIDLHAQAIRQVGDGDTTWSTIEVADDVYRDPTEVAAMRRQYHDAGIQVIDTLFQMLFASCTDPSADESDPAQLEQTLTANCIDYIEEAGDYIAAVTPIEEMVYFEAGNELFHWVTNPDYTPAEQAVISGYAIDSVSTTLRNNGYQVYSITPSIMINSEATWEWWDEFMASLNTTEVASSSDDLPYINYHYYSSAESYRTARQNFVDEGRWVDDKLMILTEFGFSDLAEYTRTENNTPQTKSQRFVQLAVMAWGAGDTAVFVHPLYYSATDNDFPGMGLVREDGSYTPEAYAYRYLAEQLVPFQQVADLSDDTSGQYIYQFITTAGQTKYIVWGSSDYTIPNGISSMTTMYSETGEFIALTTTADTVITLSDTPILLE